MKVLSWVELTDEHEGMTVAEVLDEEGIEFDPDQGQILQRFYFLGSSLEPDKNQNAESKIDGEDLILFVLQVDKSLLVDVEEADTAEDGED